MAVICRDINFSVDIQKKPHPAGDRRGDERRRSAPARGRLAASRSVMAVMSAEDRTPQTRRVLQVGPLMTVPGAKASRRLQRLPAARRSGGAQRIPAGRDRELRGRLRHHRRRCRCGARSFGQQHPGRADRCVADTAVGLMIDALRQFSAADRFVRAGRWPVDGMYPLTRQVSNTRVGIVGLGRIGSAIALRLSAFGCTISYRNQPSSASSTSSARFSGPTPASAPPWRNARTNWPRVPTSSTTG